MCSLARGDNFFDLANFMLWDLKGHTYSFWINSMHVFLSQKSRWHFICLHFQKVFKRHTKNLKKAWKKLANTEYNRFPGKTRSMLTVLFFSIFIVCELIVVKRIFRLVCQNVCFMIKKKKYVTRSPLLYVLYSYKGPIIW